VLSTASRSGISPGKLRSTSSRATTISGTRPLLADVQLWALLQAKVGLRLGTPWGLKLGYLDAERT